MVMAWRENWKRLVRRNTAVQTKPPRRARVQWEPTDLAGKTFTRNLIEI